MSEPALEDVQCPWCEARFEIDPTSTAEGFACPSCGRDSSLGALRNPDLRPDAVAIAKHRSLATAANLYRHTIAYVFIERDTNVERHASGTLVEIGRRLFIATVRHTHFRRLSEIHLVKKTGLMVPGTNSFVLRREKGESHDIAVLEISRDALPQCGFTPITLDRIHDAAHGNPNMKTTLIGYPDAYKLGGYPVKGMQGLHALSYGCECIEPSRWTTIGRRFDPDSDVVIYFSDDTVDWSPGMAVPKGRPEPYGMSGGGLWQREGDTPDDKLWSPDDLKLFAIQAGWLPRRQFCFATQIIHWLRLVADKYPDTATELRDRFPQL